MAENKKMAFLNVGKDTFEMVDEQARDDIASMKLTKVWENPNPRSPFDHNPDNPIFIDDLFKDVVLEYKYANSDFYTHFAYVRILEGGEVKQGIITLTLTIISAPNPIYTYGRTMMYSRQCNIYSDVPEYPNKTAVTFGNANSCQTEFDENGAGTSNIDVKNDILIPIAIYKVGV